MGEDAVTDSGSMIDPEEEIDWSQACTVLD